jgi:type II secretory pathway pseudopilin PulG
MIVRKPQTRFLGLGLVELLTVVAIIGILASLALFAYGRGHFVSTRETVHRRNAQQFVSLVISAQAAGADPVQTDVMATLRKLKAGVTAIDGAFAGRTFKSSGVGEADLLRAAYYLSVTDGQLVYLAQKPLNED